MKEVASSTPLPFVVNGFLAPRLIEAWNRIRWQDEVADRCIASISKRDRLGSRDRKRLAEAIFVCLRRRGPTDALVPLENEHATEQNLLWLATSLQQVLPGSGEPIPWTITAPEDPTVGGNLPPALVQALQKRWSSQELLALGEAMQKRAPITLRAVEQTGGREQLAQDLAQADCPTTPTPFATQGLICRDRRALNTIPEALRSRFEVQDEGSQLLAELVGAQPGERVLDACAGAGGKSLALLDRNARVSAHDVDEKRLQKLAQRAARNPALAADLSFVKTTQLERLKTTYDRVLIDAPCTGSGTGRRAPDLLWRFNKKRLDSYSSLQTKILRQMAPFVRPGGTLVYATCSVAPKENAEQVEKFLHEHPHFKRLDPSHTLGVERAAALGANHWLELLPQRHNTDGFFGALLLREKAD